MAIAALLATSVKSAGSILRDIEEPTHSFPDYKVYANNLITQADLDVWATSSGIGGYSCIRQGHLWAHP